MFRGGVKSSQGKGFGHLKKFNAFTLSEVLIVIAIIGVVAMLVLPPLKKNIDASIYKNRFKKTLATLNAAGEMAYAKYGTDWGLTTEDCTDGDETLETRNSFCGILNSEVKDIKYLGIVGYISYYNPQRSNTYFTSYWPNTIAYRLYQLPDGVYVAVPNFDYGSHSRASRLPDGFDVPNATSRDVSMIYVGYIDVNGPDGPNVEVSCSTGKTFDECKLDGKYLGDVFPIYFHDGIVEPIGRAAVRAFRGDK